jgi:hypothetical protein
MAPSEAQFGSTAIAETLAEASGTNGTGRPSGWTMAARWATITSRAAPPAMAARKKLSPNAQRRALARAAEKLARQREHVANLTEGGAPERPIEVASAAVVEAHGKGMPCLRCGAPCRVHEHTAATINERRLRIVRLQCPMCGATRVVYFRIVGDALN